MVEIASTSPTSTTGRRGERRPVFRSAIELQPWEITPFCCFPLLPGETLHNVLVDGRFVLNGCVSPLYPWYLDIQLYAMRLSDIDVDFEEILLRDAETPISGSTGTDVPLRGMVLGGMDISGVAYDRLANHLWSTEDELKVGVVNTDLFIAPVKWRTSSSTFVEGESAGATLEPDQIVSAKMKQDLIDEENTWARVLESYGVRIPRGEAGVPERIMWESIAKHPVFVQSDSADVIVTRYQVLWTVREARLTAKGQGIYAKEPMVVMGLATIRPELLEGNKRFMVVNDLVDRDRWWVPPFNAMDAVQDILQEPGSSVSSGHGWSDAAGGVTQHNALDYWFMGESFTNMDHTATTPPDPQLAGHVADFPRRSGTPTYSNDFPGQFAQTEWPVLKSDAFMGGNIQVQTRIKTHLAAIK